MKRAEPLLVALIFLAAAVLRLVALHADPPSWLSWSAGLYSDEGIYSEDSRLLVLYGQHMQGNFHVAALAPLHYHLLVFVFRHVATISLATVRGIAVAFSLATLLCFWATFRITYGARTAAIALALLAFSAPFLLYNRMGLLEMPALFWLTASYLALGYAAAAIRPTQGNGNRTSPAWQASTLLFAAGALAGVAVDWKATFALGALAMLTAAGLRHGLKSLIAWAGLAITVGLNYLLLVRPYHAEVARADHYYLLHQYLPHTASGVWHNLVRATISGEADGVLVYLLHFAPMLLILTIAAVAPRLRSQGDAWLWLWLAIPLTAMILMSYSPSRYFVQFWPALAGLAACAIARLPQRSVARIAFAAALCVDALLLGRSYQLRAYTVQQDAKTLEHVLPRDSWIAGQFAPTICLECSLRSLYVQPGLANDSSDNLTVLPITHVLATQTQSPADDPWRAHRGQLIAAPSGLPTLPIGPKIKTRLYANLNALP